MEGVDGCYAIYWHYKNPAALALMRGCNFPASLSLYGLCGVLWLYRGSLATSRTRSPAGDRGAGATEPGPKKNPAQGRVQAGGPGLMPGRQRLSIAAIRRDPG